MWYWENSKYSKEQINKAWISRNLEIINEFRYDHEEISKEFLSIFESEPMVLFSSRRLKRTPSIIKKNWKISKE